MDNENKWEYDYSSQDKNESGDTGYPNVGSSGMNTANQYNDPQPEASAAEPEKTWDNVKNRLEYGVSLGAGVELLRHLQVSVKYFWTLSDLYGLQDAKLDNIMQSLGNINAKNVNGIAATVTVLF